MKKKNKTKRKNSVELRKQRTGDDCHPRCPDTEQTICPECAEWAETLQNSQLRQVFD